MKVQDPQGLEECKFDSTTNSWYLALYNLATIGYSYMYVTFITASEAQICRSRNCFIGLRTHRGNRY